MIDDIFDWLEGFSGSPSFLVIIFAIALLDSVVPIVPSESMVIIGGVSAGLGDQILPLIIVCGALGAFVGDNLAFQLGRSAEGPIRRGLFRGEKGERRLQWASRQLTQRGGLLLVTGRFVPGGRTALMLASGLTAQPRRWFAGWVALAVVIWATYAALLGFIGGKTFKDNHTLAFLVAFGLAISVTVLIEAVRWLRHRGRAAVTT